MEEQSFDLKRGMNAWVAQNTSLTEFAEAMGYRYQNAWGVLRGKVPVTVDAVGRFALAYGPAALGEMLNLAGLTETLEVRFEGGRPVVGAQYGAGERGEPVYTRPVEVA